MDILFWASIIIGYIFIGILVQAGYYCYSGEVMGEGTRDNSVAGLVLIWPIILIFMSLYILTVILTSLDGMAERIVKKLGSVCQRAKQKLQDRMRED